MRRLVALVALLAACSAPSAASVAIANDTGAPLRLRVLDRGASAEQRQRRLELPAGGQVALDLRGAPARIEARSLDGTYARAHDIQSASPPMLRFAPDPLSLAAIAAGRGAALQPIAMNLAASKPTVADETDPSRLPANAVDGDRTTFWRGLNPPGAGGAGPVSWAVDLGAPATLERAQIDVECVTCGVVRVRLHLLDRALTPESYAPPGQGQKASVVAQVERMPEAVVGRIELSGPVADGDMIAAAQAQPFQRVRTVVATIVEAPENVGFYEVRLAGR